MFICRRRNEIMHVKISNDGETFELYDGDGFASVPELIDYYRSNPGQFVDKAGRSVEMYEPMVDEGIELLEETLEQER